MTSAGVMTMVIAAALAGCVQAREDVETPPTWCESYTVAESDDGCSCWWCGHWGRCEGGDCVPPSPVVPTPAPYPPTNWSCPVYAAHEELHTFLSCAIPEPPLFAPFQERVLRACERCAEAAILADGERVFVASAEGLDVVSPWQALFAPAPATASILGAWELRSPTLAHDGRDVWYAALARGTSGPAPNDILVVARWDGGAGWVREDALGLEGLGEATAAERVQLAATRDGVVALLEGHGLAWSLRVAQGLAVPEPLSEPLAPLRFGTPTRDVEGRALVPYVRAATSGGVPELGVALLPDSGSAWTFARVDDMGRVAAQGALPSLEARGEWGASAAWLVSWIDASGELVRASSFDAGVSWSPHATWREAGALSSSPASGGDWRTSTLAWTEHERILLARGDHAPEGVHELERPAAGAPALAMLGARAAVAWLAPEGLVLALEGWAEGGCGDTGHCPAVTH